MPLLDNIADTSKRLARFYLLALALIAILSVLGHAVVQMALLNLTHDSRLVNVAGRQRMLSQRISMHAFDYQLEPDSKLLSAALKDLKMLETTHLALENGTLDNSCNDQEVKGLLASLDLPLTQLSEELHQYSSNRRLGSQEARSMRRASDRFVEIMDRVVAHYESDSRSRVHRLVLLEFSFLALTLLTLGLEGWFIFRPMLGRIRTLLEEERERVQMLQIKNAEILSSQTQLTELLNERTLILESVTEAGDEVQVAAERILETTHKYRTNLKSQSSSASEIAAVSERISATARELQDATGGVAEEARDITERVQEGQVGVAVALTAMERILEHCDSVVRHLDQLNHQTTKISSVVRTIENVADTTNMLAVNATIEAEKAGEHGRGFSVVAVEVRRLSDRTANSTQDIRLTVKEIQAAVKDTVTIMDEFSDQLRQDSQTVFESTGHLARILNQVEVVSGKFTEINEGMKRQAEGAQAINCSISGLSSSLSETHVGLLELGKVASFLKGANRGLQNTVRSGYDASGMKD